MGAHSYMWHEGPMRTWVFLLCEPVGAHAFHMVGKIVVGLPRAQQENAMVRVYDREGAIVFSAVKPITKHECPRALDELLSGVCLAGIGLVGSSVVDFFSNKGIQLVQVL